ncbi:hypothetical protein B0H11DRAFT_1989125 [Mycena galericulata]|nr:hypothetical protein B0H11DRAFT_1989125 [Mycena galericulata]
MERLSLSESNMSSSPASEPSAGLSEENTYQLGDGPSGEKSAFKPSPGLSEEENPCQLGDGPSGDKADNTHNSGDVHYWYLGWPVPFMPVCEGGRQLYVIHKQTGYDFLCPVATKSSRLFWAITYSPNKVIDKTKYPYPNREQMKLFKAIFRVRPCWGQDIDPVAVSQLYGFSDYRPNRVQTLSLSESNMTSTASKPSAGLSEEENACQLGDGPSGDEADNTHNSVRA